MESLSRRLRRAPRPHDAARGREAAEALGLSGAAGELVAGAAGSSPFLAGLLAKERDWIASALERPPEDELAALVEEARAAEPRATAAALRRMKRRGALLVALADLGGAWDLDAATNALSDIADAALEAAAVAAFATETKGPLKGLGPAEAGLIVLAMGKLGARELNYSSDIDLICLFDETRWAPDDWPEVKPRFANLVRRMVKTLSEITVEGYVFRTDLRLRPNPGSTPVCLAAGAAESYYESVGRNWERAAYIKARPAAGDLAAGAAFLEALQPFVYRRHLDFAAIEEAHDMRLKIRAHKGVGERLTIPGYDVKLGLGGIREIEFFAQTQQLVRGGRDPSLRDPTTRGALRALTQAGVIDEKTRATLDADYAAHRELEHRIQMIEDAQTHALPPSEEGRERVAALGGWPDRRAMEREVEERGLRVRRVCDAFFKPQPRRLAYERPEELAELGFKKPEEAAALMERWMSGQVAATRGERARRRFRALAPALLEKLGDAASPDDAIRAFDRFLSGLPAGVQIFALFEANPQLLGLLAEICAAAPRLAAYLGRHAGALDAVLDRSFFAPPPPCEALRAELAAALAAEEDYERKLDAARRWAQERGFGVGVRLLRAVATPEESGRAFSDVAEAALAALWPVVVTEFARRHGSPPGRGAAVVALGKLGSREMTATSDLDLLVIFDPAEAERSEGPKPLDVNAYYARLTQAMIAALTAPTAEGALYSVDMRLRPSGRQGPVATRLPTFRRYQREEAWTWEHLALTRARPVAGDPAVIEAARDVITEALTKPRDAEGTRKDVREMRQRVAAAHAQARANPWALKHAEGGLMDVEFALQTGMLLTGACDVEAPVACAPRLAETGWLSAEDARALEDAHRLMTALQQIERVALDRPFDPAGAGPGLRAAMARAGGAETFAALETKLVEAQRAAAAAAERALAP